MATKFNTGMYLLETLSSGMYTEPLTIFREYIQNAVDSIDKVKRELNKKNLKIFIDVNPFKSRIKIKDNGFGIPNTEAESVLSSIGSSNKFGKDYRGFRGIGRLGGLAFCEKAIFKTKSIGDKSISIQEWDCNQLHKHLAQNRTKELTLKTLFESVTHFYQENTKNTETSFFQVELIGVKSFRNRLFDLHLIKKYLEQTVPLKFNPIFSYSKKIDNYLRKNVRDYSSYYITLNGDKLYKPYLDKIITNRSGGDFIEDIKFIKINTLGKTLAVGWIGNRHHLLGSINKQNGVSGIRVRKGNILIGDNHILDNCFRENRFNNYSIGEIHICDINLIPNSRRDDFIDNQYKGPFYNSIEEVIGLPMSKTIREKSKEQSSIAQIKIPNNNSKHKINNDLKIENFINRLDLKLIKLELDFINNGKFKLSYIPQVFKDLLRIRDSL